MDKTIHLTVDDLILFMDRELDQEATSQAERHLLQCVECGTRLRSLQTGSAAHHRYHEGVLKPALQVAESSWPRIADRLSPKRRMVWTLGWAGAAIAATLAVVWIYFPLHSELTVPGLLEKAEAVPESPRGSLLFISGKNRFARPAVLEAGASEARFQHIQTLFVQSNYSWNNPLSARSYAEWRQHLPEKRDFVTAIHEEGGRQFYRVRTRTDSGILHSASLMLEASTYHPTKASFEFQGEDLIEVSEQATLPVNEPQETQTALPSRPKTVETVAGPEDELRVFAALEAIGADAEEPIDVKLDAGHHSVLVTGMGITPDRRKQIEAALAPLPNTIVRFSSGAPIRSEPDDAVAPVAPNENASPPFRDKLQEMAGGARQLQTLTDESLETSNALFAQSHSLLVLAQEFPPEVEQSLTPSSSNTLLALRQRHLGAMSYALRRLRDRLRPLLMQDVQMTQGDSGLPWQRESEQLYDATRNLDHVVSRLLAGSYDAQTGELMLKQLPDDIAKVETLILVGGR